MTSTAEPSRLAGGVSWLRAALLLAGLALFAVQTPPPWGALWLAVPLVVAVSLQIDPGAGSQVNFFAVLLPAVALVGLHDAARFLADRLPETCIHQFAPVDVLPWVQRFLDHWRPDLAVWTESELWPS